MKLQPTKKAFENYLKLGYEYASKKKASKNIIPIIRKISLIDNGVLIIDDILDNSKLRNGKPCLYLKEGKSKALAKAEEYKAEAVKSINKLMELVKTKDSYHKLVHKKISQFFKNINKGEQINLELTKSKKPIKELLKKYKEMIRLFTGGHIKLSIEIGQLIANKQPDKNLSKIAESAGIIRQMVDDFNDYFKSHHEPFGDFINQENRLPEILFRKQKGNREKVIKFIKKNKFKEARRLILNEKVRKELFKQCQKEYNKIKSLKTKFNYSVLIEDFNKILKKI